jgi:hypothetical protein
MFYYDHMTHGEAARLDPQDFIDAYPQDTRVAFGNGMSMTLEQALQAEQMFCSAETADRQDPEKRVGYLATMLAASDSLLPEHEHYLPTPE